MCTATLKIYRHVLTDRMLADLERVVLMFVVQLGEVRREKDLPITH